jgi:two-component system response regulator
MGHLPDLVLLDLKLPKIDGSEVLRQLRNDPRTNRLCVVVFTSSSEPADIARCYALGCNSYVIKPVTYEDYIEAVRNIAAYWLALNASPARPR